MAGEVGKTLAKAKKSPVPLGSLAGLPVITQIAKSRQWRQESRRVHGVRFYRQSWNWGSPKCLFCWRMLRWEIIPIVHDQRQYGHRQQQADKDSTTRGIHFLW